MAEIMTKMMFCMTVFNESKLFQPSWKSTDWSPIGWFLNHSTNSVVVGWSDGKTPGGSLMCRDQRVCEADRDIFFSIL